MATATHGLNARLYLDGADVSEYFQEASVDLSKDTVETTAFGSASKTFIPGLRDATLSASGMLDGPIGDSIEAALAAASGKPLTYFPEGAALGKTGAGLLAVATSSTVSSGTDDVNKISFEAQANGGADRVVSLHDKTSEAATGNGTGVDNATSTATGGVAYLHVTAVTGTVTVKVQHSTDGTTWLDLETFTAASVPGGQRVTFPGTVNRHLRAQWTISGGPATFVVSAARGLPSTP